MRISDWSSDVCSSDLHFGRQRLDQQFADPVVELRDDLDAHEIADRTCQGKALGLVDKLEQVGDIGGVERLDQLVDTVGVFLVERFLDAADEFGQIGRAHVWTPVTNAHLVCRLLPEKKNKQD